MTSQPRIGDAQHSLWRSNVLMSLEGNYVESGLDVAPGSSGSAIQSEVDGGTVRFASEGEVGVAPDTLTHDPVRADYDYRTDAIYATRQGGLAIAKGQPGQPAPTTDGTAYAQGGTPRKPRSLYWPAPPDGSQINGLPIHVVVIGDTVTDSIDDRFGLDNYIDYRIPAVSPGAHTHPDLALNRTTHDLTSATGEIVKLAELHDGTSGAAAARIQLWSANALSNVSVRTLDVGVVARNSQLDVRAFERGGSVDPADLLVTEQSTDATGTTQSRYHLYARLPQDAGVYAAIEHRGDSWGEDQLVTGLGPNDVLGTIRRDTGDPATGGVRRAVAAQSDGASAGDVPVRQADGSASWERATAASGEWVPRMTQQFAPGAYTTTSNVPVIVNEFASEGLLFDFSTVEGERFDDVAVTLAGRISTSNVGTGATAQLSAGYSQISHVNGAFLYTNKGNPQRKTSQKATVDASSGFGHYYLTLDSDGSAEARIDSAAVTLWGRQR